MQAQQPSDTPEIPIMINPTIDARLAAEFYLELMKQKIPLDVAKDLTIAYILKHNPFGQ